MKQHRDQYSKQHDWRYYYLLTTVGSVVLFGATAADVRPFDWLSIQQATVLIVVAFAVVAALDIVR